MNRELLRPFTEDDILLALKQTHPHKAPGLDGLSGSFYKNHWNIVGSDVIQSCLVVLNQGFPPRSLNDTMIVLIPKVKSPRRV